VLRLPSMTLDAEPLLQFNRQLLDQALALVAAHETPGAKQTPAYSSYAGAHMRHVIEHYEALLFAARDCVVDYDARARERELEQSPALARERLLRLAQRLSHWPAVSLAAPIAVITRCGASGEFEVASRSSVGRELVYLASHAVHHFALLQVYCLQQGISMGANFGKAPSTVAFESRR
jgi:hypothetical protein